MSDLRKPTVLVRLLLPLPGVFPPQTSPKPLLSPLPLYLSSLLPLSSPSPLSPLPLPSPSSLSLLPSSPSPFSPGSRGPFTFLLTQKTHFNCTKYKRAFFFCAFVCRCTEKDTIRVTCQEPCLYNHVCVCTCSRNSGCVPRTIYTMHTPTQHMHCPHACPLFGFLDCRSPHCLKTLLGPCVEERHLGGGEVKPVEVDVSLGVTRHGRRIGA